MMEKNERIHLLRKALLNYIKIQPRITTDSDQLELDRLLTDYKFSVIETACSAMQGTTDLTEHIRSHEEIAQQIQLILNNEQSGIVEDSFLVISQKAKEVFDLSIHLSKENSTTRIESPLLSSLQELSETVYVTNGQLEAESIQLFLESFAIRSRFIQESAGVAMAFTVGPLVKQKSGFLLLILKTQKKY